MKMQETLSYTFEDFGKLWPDYYAQGMRADWSGWRWACNECIETGRAIAAQPWLQTFCDHKPYLAYFDQTYFCKDCRTEFVFSGKEQQYWYEELKFWVQSFPLRCLPCRRKRRERNMATQTLQKQLEELPVLPLQEPQQLLEIAGLYLLIGSQRKVTEFVGRAQSGARARGEMAAFAEQIEAFKQRIQEEFSPQGQEKKK